MTTIHSHKPTSDRMERSALRPTGEPDELWAMSHEERVSAMYAGELTQRQCFEWARREPDTVPLLDGEFWFIAVLTPEVCENGRC